MEWTGRRRRFDDHAPLSISPLDNRRRGKHTPIMRRSTLSSASFCRRTFSFRRTCSRQLLSAVFASVTLGVLALSVGGCSDKKNAEAKKRLLTPETKNPLDAKADEKLDASAVGSDDTMRRRVNRMAFGEVKRRLNSLSLHSEAVLSFERGTLKIKSSEVVDLKQAKEGDFSLTLVTGDENRQEVASVNDVFFLKNNNGRWRISRDPSGERERLREDSAGVWRSFYDLFNHALVFQKEGSTSYEGRSVVRYRMNVKNLSEQAKELGAQEPQPDPTPPAEVDGGAPKVDPKVENKKLMGRMEAWRKNARAAGGRGEMLVDEKTGVILKLDFTGKMVVGDGPTPAELNVRIKVETKDIGKALIVSPPKNAVAEITREKFPVAPRAPFEKKGVVAPAPKKSTGAKDGETK